MGLFGSGIQRMSNADVEAAVERIANYYRQSRLYLSLCPGNDAYQYFIDEYTEDIRLMVKEGFCYKYKGNYLIATDLDDFFAKYLDVAKHFYGCIPHIMRKTGAEKEGVIYINSLGPAGNQCDANTYKLVKDFVNMKFDRKYVFLSDATAGVDLETDYFQSATGARKMLVDGEPYYRWG